jgi:O-methyltransferase involved in polyketide biosynthesis
MYYSIIITFVMMSHDDLDETGRPCLRAECHSWYQSIMGVIHHVRLYFCKTMVRKCLHAHIRTIVVLIGGKLT